jgi:hypothetical protein
MVNITEAHEITRLIGYLDGTHDNHDDAVKAVDYLAQRAGKALQATIDVDRDAIARSLGCMG